MREFESAIGPAAGGRAASSSVSALRTLGERFHRGDVATLAEVLRDVCPRIRRALMQKYKALLPDHELEQIVLNALERAWEHHADYDPARALKPWLQAIADHLAVDFLDSPEMRGRRLEIATDPGRLDELHDPNAPDPAACDAQSLAEDRPLAENRRELVQQGLEAIREPYREVLVEFAFSPDGRIPASELAARDGVTVSAVYKRLARAIPMLEAELHRLGVENLLSCPRRPYLLIEGIERSTLQNGERRTENGERRTENGERRTIIVGVGWLADR